MGATGSDWKKNPVSHASSIQANDDGDSPCGPLPRRPVLACPPIPERRLSSVQLLSAPFQQVLS